MMGVGNRVSTSQVAWDWATVTYGAGTDSIMWTYNWGVDSLILGENLVCCVPLEEQVATTNNLGLGTPFAGNIEVYPLYRVEPSGGLEEASRLAGRMTQLPTIIRCALMFEPANGAVRGSLGELLDVSGRKVLDLKPGANDVSRLAPGVYFVKEAHAQAQPQAVRKVVIAK